MFLLKCSTLHRRPRLRFVAGPYCCNAVLLNGKACYTMSRLYRNIAGGFCGEAVTSMPQCQELYAKVRTDLRGPSGSLQRLGVRVPCAMGVSSQPTGKGRSTLSGPVTRSCWPKCRRRLIHSDKVSAVV